MGAVLYLQGKWDKAEEAFESAISGRASDALVARLNLAVLHYDRGERNQAMLEFGEFIDLYNRSRELSSEELTAVATASRYLGAEDPQLYKDALRALDEAIAADPRNLEPRVKVGELFLEKYNATEAYTAFDAVLALNPSQPRALLGMARVKRFDGSPEALEFAERSLAVNSNLVPARVFLATLRLESEDYDGAAQEAEKALEVNPASLEALAALAATRFLSGDHAGFQEAERRAQALNPHYADLYNSLADLSARNRLYQSAVDLARRAIELDSTSWRGYALLGINQLRIGEIEKGTRNLEIAFRGDPYDVWTKNTLDLLDTFDGYAETRSDRFVFVIAGEESPLLSLYFGELAEEAYDRLAKRYGFRPTTPIRVEVLRTQADFSVRTIGLTGMGALGVSFGPVVAMDSPGAREIGQFNWGSTLWHELAHTFHLGMTQNKVPRWFSEGLAVYEERRARPGWGDDVTPGFLVAHLQGKLLSVGNLNDGFTRPTYPEQVIHSYYQASLVCEYVETRHGRDALLGMLAGYRDGKTGVEVFRTVLDTDVEDFSDSFFEYMEERFQGPLKALEPASRTERAPASREEIEALARENHHDFAAQLTLARLLYAEQSVEEAAPYFERAKALFPQYAGPDSPYWYLALISKSHGSLERAAEELASLTSINERDYRANLELADVLEATGDLRGATGALDRAIYIYPFDMNLHRRLAEAYADVGEPTRAIRERRAVLALDPIDRPEALYQLALAYFGAADLSAARRTVLQALEDAPNFEKAQDLLLEIRAAFEDGR